MCAGTGLTAFLALRRALISRVAPIPRYFAARFIPIVTGIASFGGENRY